MSSELDMKQEIKYKMVIYLFSLFWHQVRITDGNSNGNTWEGGIRGGYGEHIQIKIQIQTQIE